MASDDLNAPLGQDKRKKLPKLPVAAPQLLAGVLGLFGLLVVSWAVFVNDPLGGEPVAVVATKPPAASQAKQDADSDGKQHSRYDGPAATAPIRQLPPPRRQRPPRRRPAARPITIIDGSSGKSQDVVIPGNASGAAPARRKPPVDQKLLETTRHGAIPKIGPDGARPSALYAQPRAAAAQPEGRAAHRHRDRRPRHQRLRHRRCLRQAARRR